jgi:hypothetical protein
MFIRPQAQIRSAGMSLSVCVNLQIDLHQISARARHNAENPADGKAAGQSVMQNSWTNSGTLPRSGPLALLSGSNFRANRPRTHRHAMITASATIAATMTRNPTASIFFMGHIGDVLTGREFRTTARAVLSERHCTDKFSAFCDPLICRQEVFV